MSLGLTGQNPYSPYLPPPVHKSAGLAFGLSLLIPGAGQFYCGKNGRGGMTLAFWLLGLMFCFTGVQQLVGLGLGLMVVLWIFSFLDAYFTAIEVSRGLDEQVDVQNPRVAAVLNLLTSGFGYFYLGERTKGIALFIVMQVARFLLLPKVSGITSTLISIVLLIVQFAVAADAYRIAQRQVKEVLGPEATPPPGAAPASRLPKEVPLALAGLLIFGFVIFAIVGLLLGPRFAARQRLNTRSNRRPNVVIPQRAISPVPVDDSVPIEAIDLTTAVLDVRRVQRRNPHTKDDIPSLTRDIQVLSSIVDRSKAVTVDEVVARFNRAVALALINMVHEHDGEPMDAAVALKARSDLDKIIHGPSLAFSQTQGVTIANSEYWAGYIARSQLHDEKGAYAYWEKCASDAHAGCISNVAEAHITGAGGQSIDVRYALDLLTAVYNSGTKYHCAGAGAALNIAEINYFMGVRRPGDDDLEWAHKADVLWDRLQMNNRNECLRGENEIEEFLLQLSRGHRDDNILQDALSRLDDDATAPKAVIQYISGAIDEAALLAAVQADKSQNLRCDAYFDIAWYARLHSENALAQRYYQRMLEIGKFYCGVNLVFAGKLNPQS